MSVVSRCCFRVICYIAVDNKYTLLHPCHSIPIPKYFFFFFPAPVATCASCSSSVFGPEPRPLQMFSNRGRNAGHQEGQCHSSENPQVGGLRREEEGSPQSQVLQRYHSLLAGTGARVSHLFRRMLFRAQDLGSHGLWQNKFSFMPLLQTIPFRFPLPSGLQA